MQRIHSIDFLKLIIACGVVWAHAVLLTNQGGVAAYMFGQGLVRTVVPTFAVVSGFLFHSTLENGRAKRWLLRLLVVYLFWFVIYLPIWWPRPFSATELAWVVVFGPIHLWYMAALMVALTLLRWVVLRAGDPAIARRRLLWSAVILLAANCMLQSADFFLDVDMNMYVYRNGIGFEYPYVCFGYLIAERIKRRGIASLPEARLLWPALGGLAILRLAEAAVSLRLYGLSTTAPPEVPFLLVAFVVTVVLVTIRTKLPKPAVNLSFLSMMIYFLHLGFLAVAIHFGVRNIALLLILGIGVPVICAFCMMFGVTTLQRWFPAAGIWGWLGAAARKERLVEGLEGAPVLGGGPAR